MVSSVRCWIQPSRMESDGKFEVILLHLSLTSGNRSFPGFDSCWGWFQWCLGQLLANLPHHPICRLCVYRSFSSKTFHGQFSRCSFFLHKSDAQRPSLKWWEAYIVCDPDPTGSLRTWFKDVPCMSISGIFTSLQSSGTTAAEFLSMFSLNWSIMALLVGWSSVKVSVTAQCKLIQLRCSDWWYWMRVYRYRLSRCF